MNPWLALGFALAGCASIAVVPQPPEAEQTSVRTDDGWTLALTRYPARAGRSPGRPVILAHGISANARNLDLDEQHSLAQWFAAQGREAWLVSWRGTAAGGAREVPPKDAAPIVFDDFWRHDLPAIIASVRQRSGAETVDYVGHSMGGMVVYAYLSQGGGGLNAVATLGAPINLNWGTALGPLVGGVAPVLPQGWNMPSAVGAWLLAPVSTWASDDLVQRLFYNPQSTKPETFRRLLAYGTGDTATGVARQLAPMVTKGEFRSADGAIDFGRDMARISVPVLVVAAIFDRLAVTPAVRAGYLALGGPKRWLLIGRANGAAGEYGHMDLVIGERAADEVWSPVLHFLQSPSDERATP